MTRALRWALALMLAACGGTPGGHAEWSGRLMGSSARIEASGLDQATCELAVAEAKAEIERLDVMMTDWKPDSPLMDINKAAGLHPVTVPPELLFVIQRSLALSELTDGAFDISFAGAGKLWNWRDPDPKIPSRETVALALQNVGWRGIVVDAAASTVYLSRPGMRIGLDGIAPGYAADRAMAKIRAHGIRDAVVDMSGDLILSGHHEGEPWPVSIANPRKPGEIVAFVPVSNAAVATSGDYERFFVKDGKRYGHIIDPRTGYPADGCQSVTVIAPGLAFANALAVALFVLGPDKGIALAETLDGVQAIIVAADGAVLKSRRSGAREPRPVK